MALRGMIFDVDGTLVLSNDAHTHAWVAALAAAGYQIPFERVRPLMGMGGDHLLPELVPGLSADEGPGKAIAEHRMQIFLTQYVPHLQPTPGARRLVAHVQQMGMRTIVASSAKQDELTVLLKAAQVADLLTETTTSDDAKSSKPAPDIVSVAREKLGMSPDEVIMLGDTRFDVESARESGVAVIGVRCGGSSDHDLAGAIALYNDPEDLLIHLATSPLNAADFPFRDQAAGGAEETQV